MSGVPEIDVPSVSPESVQPGTAPAPSLGAFRGQALGEGLSATGKALYAEGMDAYRKAVEATAQAKELEFQTKAAAIRAQYKTLPLDKAVQAHEAVTTQLQQLFSDVGSSIPSKDGQRLYGNAAMRRLQYAQEGIDQHFESQNRALQFSTHKALQAEDVAEAGRQAVAGNLKRADEISEQAVKREKEFRALHGEAPEAADAYVSLLRSTMADGIVGSLAKLAAKDPQRLGDLQAATAKYQDLLSAKGALAAQTAQDNSSAALTAADIVSKLPTMDFATGKAGASNPGGLYDASAVAEAKKAYSNAADPVAVRVSKQIDAAVKQREAEVKAGVHQAMKVIDGAQVAGQPFSLSHADPAALATIQMNDGTLYRGLMNKADREKRAAEGHELHATRVAQNANYQMELEKIDTMPIDQLRKLTEDDLRSEVLKLGGGMSETQTQALLKRFKQNLKDDPEGLQRGRVTALINGGVTAALGNGGSAKLRAQAKQEIRQTLLDAYAAKPGMTEKEATEFVQSKLKLVPNGSGFLHGSTMQWQLDAKARTEGGASGAAEPKAAGAQEQIFTGKSGKKFVLRNGQYEPYEGAK